MFYCCPTEGCTHAVCRFCALENASPPVLEKEGTVFEAIHECALKPLYRELLEQKEWTCQINKVYPKLTCDSFLTKGNSAKVYGLTCK